MIAALVVLAGLLTSCTDEEPAPLGEGHYRWEGIEGFAIWPEDHPEAALQSCEERLDDEPWRGDPGAVATEFVESVLGWEEPPDLSDHEVPEDSPRGVFTIVDGSMPADALGVVVHVRQLRGCWFVVQVIPREGDVAIRYDWVREADGYTLRVRWKGSPINFEVGWGDDVTREKLTRGEVLTIPTPDPDLPGHVLAFYDEPSEHTFGQPLSPPPKIP